LYCAVGGRPRAPLTRTRLGASSCKRTCEKSQLIRQQIARRIANFIHHLLGNRGAVDESAGVGGFGDHATAVGKTFGNREAHVLPAGHFAPVGKEPAGALGAAFDQVPHKAAGGEGVVVVGGPLEFMHQGSQRERAVDAAAGDHNIRAGGKGRGNRRRAQIGVNAPRLGGQRGARIHFANIGCA